MFNLTVYLGERTWSNYRGKADHSDFKTKHKIKTNLV